MHALSHDHESRRLDSQLENGFESAIEMKFVHPPYRSESVDSRRLSISLSQSIENCKDFCRATYDYDATGSDEITFEEGDTIRILKRRPNGVDDGWWLGEMDGSIGLFPSIVVEEVTGSSDTEASPTQASSMASPPSFAPPSFSPPSGLPPSLPPAPPPAAPPARPTPPAPARPPAAAPPPPRPPPEAETAAASAAATVTKPSVPCVQVSVDEVPEIPRDPTVDEVPEIPRDPTFDEGERGRAPAPPPGGGQPQQASIDVMDIVVTAPTPTVQSPVSEEMSDEAQRHRQQQEEQGRCCCSVLSAIRTGGDLTNSGSGCTVFTHSAEWIYSKKKVYCHSLTFFMRHLNKRFLPNILIKPTHLPDSRQH